uniref:Peptidase n=1 Tax=Rice ragged stunt virus TaxID=42475 RepID=A0A7L5KUW8_RRSV|nr:peptidase [Rice ragged stunt virus]
MEQRQYILDLVRRELTDTPQTQDLQKLTERINSLEKTITQLGTLLLGPNSTTAHEVSSLATAMQKVLYYNRAKAAISDFIMAIPRYPLYSYYSNDDIDDYHLAVVNRKPILPQFRYLGLMFGKPATGIQPYNFEVSFNLSKVEQTLISELAPTESQVIEDMRRDSTMLLKAEGRYDKSLNVFTVLITIITSNKLIYSQRLNIPGHRVTSFELMIIANAVHTTVFEPAKVTKLPVVNGDIVYNEYHFEIRVQDMSTLPSPAFHARTIQSIKKTWRNADFSTGQLSAEDATYEPKMSGAEDVVIPHVYGLAESCEILTISDVYESVYNFESLCYCYSKKSGMEMAVRMMMLALELMRDDYKQVNSIYDVDHQTSESVGILAGITEGLLANAKAIALLVKHAVLSEELQINLNSIEQSYSRLVPLVPIYVTFDHVGTYSKGDASIRDEPFSLTGLQLPMFAEGLSNSTIKTKFKSTWSVEPNVFGADHTIDCYESDDFIVLLKPKFAYWDHRYSHQPVSAVSYSDRGKSRTSYVLDCASSYNEESSLGYTSLFLAGRKAASPCALVNIPLNRSVKFESVSFLITSKRSVLPISGENLFGEIDMYIGRVRGTLNCNKFTSTEYIDRDGYKRYGLIGKCTGGSLLNASLSPLWVRLFCGGHKNADQIRFIGFSRTPVVGTLSGESLEVYPMPGSIGSSGTLSQSGRMSIYNDVTSLEVTLSVRHEASLETVNVYAQSEIPGAALSTEIRDYIRQQNLYYSDLGLREEEAMIQGAVVMRTTFRGKLYVTKGTDSIPQSVYVWNTQLNDLAVAVKMTADLANAAEIRSKENQFRLNEMEQAVREIENQLLLSGIIDGLAALTGPATPVVKKAASLVFGAMKNMSRSGFRILAAGLTNSYFKTVMTHFLGTRKGVEVWRGLGSACAESSVMIKMSGKTKPIVKEGSTDLFLADKNFILADPIEFAKHNISTKYGGNVEQIGNVVSDSERLAVGGDLGSHVVTVFHRPLSILPEPLRTLLFKLSTSGLSKRDLSAREAWIRQTLHPTHSYATISYDYVLPKTGGNRRVLCFAGVGDPNPYNLPTGDKNVGIGSYMVEFDIIGLDKDTGVKVMRPVPWKQCGYTEEQVWSIYKTLGKEYRKVELKPYTVEDAWRVIAKSSHKRVLSDKAIISTPISYERQRAIEYMLSSHGFDYNLVLNNCQDFTRGLFDYARGGPVPDFIENDVRIAMIQSTSRHFAEVCSWGGV